MVNASTSQPQPVFNCSAVQSHTHPMDAANLSGPVHSAHFAIASTPPRVSRAPYPATAPSMYPNFESKGFPKRPQTISPTVAIAESGFMPEKYFPTNCKGFRTASASSCFVNWIFLPVAFSMLSSAFFFASGVIAFATRSRSAIAFCSHAVKASGLSR